MEMPLRLFHTCALRASENVHCLVLRMQVCCPQVWRYYLLSNRPEVSDSDFKWTDMIARSNNELLANLGNFVNRALAFTVKQ